MNLDTVDRLVTEAVRELEQLCERTDAWWLEGSLEPVFDKLDELRKALRGEEG